MPILRDRTVLIFMLLLAVFDHDNDDSLKNIKQNIFSIFTSHLIEKSANDASYDMQNINKCVETLPRLLKIFFNMKKTRN